MTSEHKRAARAELAAALILFTGLYLILLGRWPVTGAFLAAVAAALFASVNRHYAASRGEVKAAAVRRPVDVAPKVI